MTKLIAAFKTSRLSNFLMGLGSIAGTFGIVYLAVTGTEEDLLNTRVRRGGGLLKLIEQTLGWDLFVILMIIFAAGLAVFAFVSLWKAINTTPDIAVFENHLEFHPAIRPLPATYDKISHWSAKKENGNLEMKIHFHESFWSLQNMIPKSFIKLDGTDAQMAEIFGHFSRDHELSLMFVDWDRQ